MIHDMEIHESWMNIHELAMTVNLGNQLQYVATFAQFQLFHDVGNNFYRLNNKVNQIIDITTSLLKPTTFAGLFP